MTTTTTAATTKNNSNNNNNNKNGKRGNVRKTLNIEAHSRNWCPGKAVRVKY